MNVYAFDRNGIYTGVVQAQAGPVPGSFIFPAGTTPEAPPSDEPGKWIWEGLAWREVTKADRAGLIKAELDDLDRRSIRPLRAVDNGTDTDEDHQKLVDLETRAAALRAELEDLNG